MKALVLTDYLQFEIRDVPTPPIADDEVLIKVRAVGICGSDVHGMTGATGRRIPPIIMGHEASGVVAETGRSVKRLRGGERVTFDSTVNCGECDACRRGRVNLCDNRRVLGVSCDEYRRDGAMTEYIAVPERIVYPMPDGMTFEQAAMVEAVSIAFHGVSRAGVSIGDTVVVVGTGMIGLLLIQTARLSGAGRIIAVDIDDRKLEFSRQFGVDETINSAKLDAASRVFDLTDGRGAHVALEAVGIEASVNAAIASVRKGGRVVLIGNLAPQIQFPLQSVVTREIDLRGSCASSGEIPACLEMIASGRIDVDGLISRVAPLEEGGKWFHALHEAREPLFKVILAPALS